MPSSEALRCGTPAAPTLLADLHYQEPGAAETLARALREQIAGAVGDRPTYMPVVFNIGANSSTGDSLGPFVGWFLRRKGFSGLCIGDLAVPVHATNLREKISETWLKAMRQGKFPYIIAVDAAVGRPGRITLNPGALQPGAGMGKNLPSVGNLHIMGGTASFPYLIWFSNLDQTVAMAEVIADALILALAESSPAAGAP